jgi:IclR family acetate operon transcriptional repressor
MGHRLSSPSIGLTRVHDNVGGGKRELRTSLRTLRFFAATVTNVTDTPAKPRYPIESVDNALRLLLMFSERRSVRIADASRELDIARSTAHRLMQMLQYHGFVQQDSGSSAYLAGSTLVELGLAVVRDLDVRSLARPELESLAIQLGETAHLVELVGSAVLFLDSVEAPRAVRVGRRTGVLLPAHATSAGKALLAALPAERVRELYPSATLPRLTKATTTSRRALEAELGEIRKQGFATNIGESEPDIGAVGVAICDTQGVPRGAISVSVPLSRFDEADVPRIAEVALAAAHRIQAALP